MRMAPLGDVARYVNGVAFRETDWGEHGLPIVRIQNLTDPSKPLNRTTRSVSGLVRARPGDLLVSWSATLGVFSWPGPEDALVNQHIFRVLPNEDAVDRQYLRHMLGGALRDMERHLHGATMKHVNRSEFLGTTIPLPPLEEQRRIAAILDQADALITTRREALRLVGMLSASVYDELFGDPTSNPRGWPRRRLRDVCDAINDCPHSTPRWTVAGEVCLRTSNLSTGGWDWSDTRYVSPQDYSVRSARAEIAPGDVILSREGTVGVAAIVEPGMRVCMGQRLVHVRTDRARVLARFLLRTLLILLAPQRIGQVMVGSTSRHLNVRDLRSLEVVVPPLELQEQFDRAMARLEAAAEVAGRQILEAQSLQGALTELAFKGEL